MNIIQIIFFSIAWIICGGIIMFSLSFVTSLFLYFLSDMFLGFVSDLIDGMEVGQLNDDELSSFTFILYPFVVLFSIPVYFIIGPFAFAFINSICDTKNYVQDVYFDLKDGKEELWYE